MSTPVGMLLGGRYRLDVRIGQGGMSTVYRAFDTVLERSVAVKLMHREISADSDHLERFRREARAVAQLNHPHIVTVIDAGEDDNMAYIVFEYVDGENLKDRLRREGPLPVTEAVAYAIEVGRALAAAHERHIVHRDVKPQNVLLGEEGSAKITDFGIARTLTEEGLTADGRVLGTTDYVSPEQALGHSVTGQSDVYSLGVMLYEMLTGEVPFHGESPVSVAMKHVREEVPDVQTRRPHVSAALAAVVERATAKDLAHRYDSAESMTGELEEVLAIETTRSGHVSGEATMVLRSLPAPTRRRVPLSARLPLGVVVLFGALALAAVGVVLFGLADHAHRGAPAAATVTVPRHLSVVALAQNAAHDYDPFGDGQEHHSQVPFAIDGDPGTQWTTETYYGGTLDGKPGVGLYVDAKPGVAATQVELQTTTPGFAVSIYAANAIARTAVPAHGALRSLGWRGPLGSDGFVRNGVHIPLSTRAGASRYYLVWITKLPGGRQNAAISELTLLRLSR